MHLKQRLVKRYEKGEKMQYSPNECSPKIFLI